MDHQRHFMTDIASLVPFPDVFSYFGCASNMVLSIFIVFFNGIALYFNGKRLDTASSIFIQSLCFTNLFLGITQLSLYPSQLYNGGYSWGQLGCHISYTFFVACSAIESMSIASIAFERYLITNWYYKLSFFQTYFWIFVIWTYGFVCTLAPFCFGFSQHAIILTDDHLNCQVDWKSNNPSTKGMVWTVALSLVLILNLTAFSYIKVYFSYRNALKSSSREDIDRHDRLVLFKSIALTVVFYTLWMPESAKIIYELFTKNPAGSLANTISSNFLSLNSALDPLLVTLLDAHLKRDIQQAFRLKSLSPKLPKPKSVALNLFSPSIKEKETLKIDTLPNKPSILFASTNTLLS